MARKISTALRWIVAEAKKLKRSYPHRFKKWTDYVSQASAIYASKHGGKSPVGKKHKRVSGIGKGEHGRGKAVQPLPGPQYIPGYKGSHRTAMGAVKYIERGEKRNARSRIVRVNRTKGGRFKSFKHLSGTAVNAVTTTSKSHVDKNRITANIQVGSMQGDSLRNDRILLDITAANSRLSVAEKYREMYRKLSQSKGVKDRPRYKSLYKDWIRYTMEHKKHIAELKKLLK
jgi:hypothetical protein